jgi:AcrR family transcriptional regulator
MRTVPIRERAYAATSVRDISAAAGMLPGRLHYRFATKESLLRALMERGMARALAATREAIESSIDPFERIRLAIRAHLRLLVEGDDAVYVLLYELRSLEAEDRRPSSTCATPTMRCGSVSSTPRSAPAGSDPIWISRWSGSSSSAPSTGPRSGIAATAVCPPTR